MTTILIIDLFCGAGGVPEGFEQASVPGVEFRVLAGVNHDAKAIESHAANHPDTHHFTEDIRDMAVVKKVAELAKVEREKLQRIGNSVVPQQMKVWAIWKLLKYFCTLDRQIFAYWL